MASAEEYVAARAAYLKSNDGLLRMGTILSQVGGELQKPESRFHFANTGIGLPMEYMSGPGLAAGDLPTAAQIQQAIADRAAARERMTNLWAGLSADMRAAMQPPPR